MNALLVRLKRFGFRVPQILWQRVISAEAKRSGKSLEWFTPEHHRVRDLAVATIAATGAPVSPGELATASGVGGDRLAVVLDELEKSDVPLPHRGSRHRLGLPRHG